MIFADFCSIFPNKKTNFAKGVQGRIEVPLAAYCYDILWSDNI